MPLNLRAGPRPGPGARSPDRRAACRRADRAGSANRRSRRTASATSGPTWRRTSAPGPGPWPGACPHRRCRAHQDVGRASLIAHHQATNGTKQPISAARYLPLKTQTSTKNPCNSTPTASAIRRPKASASMSVTPSGLYPRMNSPRHAPVSPIISTETRPSFSQYTSCRCRISANSSSTRDAPAPTRTAAISIQGDWDVFRPNAISAPRTSRMMPGTAWWTWVPDAETLSRNGPRPARIIRVITRVVRKVRTKASRQIASGSFPASTTSSSHHAPIRRS